MRDFGRAAAPLFTACWMAGCASGPGDSPGPAADEPGDRAVRADPGGAPLDLTGTVAPEHACAGEVVRRGGQAFLALPDGSLVARAPLRPVADGAPYAYHPDDLAGGAILHRCNAGEVRLPDGTAYEGAASNAVCTGRFARDAAAIEAAGWADPSVGAIRWHGVAAEGSARVAGQRVPRVRPLVGETGFYVSQTALTDAAYPISDPRRYADAASVPYAAVRRDQGVALGSYGVAYRTRGCGARRACDPVPFVVADHGPRAGAGSLALSYAVSGLALPERFDARNRYRGRAGPGDVLTVFFGGEGERAPLDAASVRERADEAFEAWGGEDRLYRCRRVDVPMLDGEAS